MTAVVGTFDYVVAQFMPSILFTSTYKGWHATVVLMKLCSLCY